MTACFANNVQGLVSHQNLNVLVLLTMDRSPSADAFMSLCLAAAFEVQVTIARGVLRWFCESKLVKMIVCSYFVLFFKLGRSKHGDL